MAKLPEETQASWAAITTGRLQVCYHDASGIWQHLVIVLEELFIFLSWWDSCHFRRQTHWTSLSQPARRRGLWAATTTTNTSRTFTSPQTLLFSRSVFNLILIHLSLIPIIIIFLHLSSSFSSTFLLSHCKGGRGQSKQRRTIRKLLGIPKLNKSNSKTGKANTKSDVL